MSLFCHYKIPKKRNDYLCKSCDYITCNKKDYNKHIHTQKHLSLISDSFVTNCHYKIPKNPLMQDDVKEYNLCDKMNLCSNLNVNLMENNDNFCPKNPLMQYDVKEYNLCDKMNLCSTLNVNLMENNDNFCPKNPLMHNDVKENNLRDNATLCSKIHVNLMENNNIQENKIYACLCGKQYKVASGLWRHKKKCEELKINIEQQTKKITLDQSMLDAFMTLMNQNQEFKELIIEQNKQAQDLQQHLLNANKEGIIINNNTTNNSFNLHVYLNETCKDAINMLDYVNSLNLELSDLEETGKLGYSNGMSRIFINGLKDMDIHKRPIHCSDLKREILYIKEDNVWEKDNENRDGIKNALRKIEQKNIQQIPLWIKAHPNCVISSNRENTPYLKMVMQSTGGQNPEETENMSKIITNIAKAVVINK